MPRLLDYANAAEHSPTEGETLEEILAKAPYAEDEITVDEVAHCNWGTTDPAEVNFELHKAIGCKIAEPDPAKTVLKPSEGPETPGKLKIPKLWRPEKIEDAGSVAPKVVQKGPPAPVVTGHYVIVGRGAAALYNHLCLRYDGLDLSSGAAKPYTWGKERMNWEVGPKMGDRQLVREEKDERKVSPSVMHIAPKIEPWSLRKDERMGQHPHMLDLFTTVCPEVGAPAGDADDWLPSQGYAAVLGKIESHLKTLYDSSQDWKVGGKDRPEQPKLSTRLVFLEGFVGTVERKADVGGATDSLGGWGPFGPVQQHWWSKAGGRRVETAEWKAPLYPFRLNAWLHAEDDSWSHEHVYAYKIDVCVGLLPELPVTSWHKHTSDEIIKDAGLWQEAVDSGTSANRGPRRIMSGQDYLGTTRKDEVLIHGGTPIGAQACQYALEMPGRDGVEQVAADKRAGINVHDFKVSGRGGAAGRVTWTNKYDFHTGGWVPGLRNLLEAAANEEMGPVDDRWKFSNFKEDTADGGTCVVEYLKSHHGLPVELADPVENSPRLAIRIGGLYKLSYIDLESIEKAEGKLKCTFKHNDRGPARLFHPDGPDGVPIEVTLPIGGHEAKLGEDLDAVRQARKALIQKRDQKRPKPDPSAVSEEEQLLEQQLTLVKGKAEKGLAIDYLLVDQYIHSTRTDDAKTRPQTFAFMLGDIALSKLMNGDLAGGLLVGWQGESEAIRVLGSASRTISWGDGEFKGFCNKMNREGHAAGGGLNLWIPLTRRANHLLTPVVALNTATAEELQKAGLDQGAADFIIAARCVTNRGLSVATLASQMRSKDSGKYGTAAGLLESKNGSTKRGQWRNAIDGKGDGTLFAF